MRFGIHPSQQPCGKRRHRRRHRQRPEQGKNNVVCHHGYFRLAVVALWLLLDTCSHNWNWNFVSPFLFVDATSSRSDSNGSGFPQQRVIQITEWEVYNETMGAWVGAPHRWTTTTTTTTDPTMTPLQQQHHQQQEKIIPSLPPNKIKGNFQGDWKIVTSQQQQHSEQQRDEWGWEYLWSPPSLLSMTTDVSTSSMSRSSIPTRRRTWLRTLAAEALPSLVQEQQQEKEKREKEQQQQQQQQDYQAASVMGDRSTSKKILQQTRSAVIRDMTSQKQTQLQQIRKQPHAKNILSSSPSRKRRQRQRKRISLFPSSLSLNNIESFNFKGFGLAYWKSLSTKYGQGLSLRLPLSYHFEAWERRPALPSISCSLGLMYPWCIATFLNLSLNMQHLNWLILQQGGDIWKQAVARLKILVQTLMSLVVHILLVWPSRAIQKLLSLQPFVVVRQKGSSTSDEEDYTTFRNEERTSSTSNSNSNSKRRTTSASDSSTAAATTRTFLGRPLPPRTAPSKPDYVMDVSYRVGVSLSWRMGFHEVLSYYRNDWMGGEVRLTWWHSYIPTLFYWNALAARCLGWWCANANKLLALLLFLFQKSQQQNKEIPSSKKAKATTSTSSTTSSSATVSLEDQPWVQWLQRHTASFGVTSGGRAPMPPHNYHSAELTMSGIYTSLFQSKETRALVAAAAAAAAAAASKETPPSTSFPVAVPIKDDDDGDDDKDVNTKRKLSEKIATGASAAATSTKLVASSPTL